MPPFQLPTISGLPSLSTIERATVLDALFEPCEALHTLSLDLLHTQKFESYNDLIASVGVQLTEIAESPSTSDTAWLDKILGAHPRLGAKKVDSAQSQAEQAQLNTGGEEEARKLKDLNDEYEKVFPGLIYVVFVNGRSRPVIMENMRSRIDRGDIKLERAEAIKAMCDIAADRAFKLQQV
ncbi:Oxo-4-hydroxy-4-carboxy-5-ureidoimidazoline decarboxylase [Leptodontidium sp. MPI-SDFR-AT-0119]|nr:Oxo-4-hydroxy-4-carboxy-5-ureidoimidazoline decarboxylase [Leptodontidium sp. MPI-SDFR-AT-0119]